MATVTNAEAAENIAENVARLLADRDWSQRELSRRTKDPHMSIVNALSGDHIPNAGILARMAEALETTVDSLLSRPKAKTPKKSRRSA